MARFIEGCDRRQQLFLPDCVDDYMAEDSPVRGLLTGRRSACALINRQVR